MKKLTKTYTDGTFGVADDLPCGENSHQFKDLLINTLGDYEDIGLTPEEIKYFLKDFGISLLMENRVLNKQCKEDEEIIGKMAIRLKVFEEKYFNMNWIPVSERLPKKSEIYLATFIENGNQYVERFYYSTICGWMMNVDWQDEGRIDKIIAWKPLPEPYKE